jgi:hypothetical protein
MSLGVGIAFNNALAVLTGFFGQPGEFVRTPKFGVTDKNRSWRKQTGKRKIKWQPFAELAIGFYLMSCLVLCIVEQKVTAGLPFLCLFMGGYLYVPLTTWFGHAFAGAEHRNEAAEPLGAAPGAPAKILSTAGRRRGPQLDNRISGHPVAARDSDRLPKL